MNAFTKPVFFFGARVVMLSLLLGALLVYVPVLSVAAAPLLPIPVAYTVSKYNVMAGLVISLVTGATLLMITGLAAGLLVFMLMALAGVTAGIGLRRGISQMRLFLVLAAMFCLLLMIWLGVLVIMSGAGPIGAMEQLTNNTLEPARSVYVSLGMSEQDANDLVSQVRDFAMALPYMAPALLLVFSVVFSGASMAVARRVFKRLSQPFPPAYVFRNLRVHFGFAYMMILGLLCQLLAPYLPDSSGSVVDLVGANVLIISEAIFFVQGMAIASYFIWRHKITGVKKIAIYSGLVLLQLTLSLTSWMGLFDTWIDYRRRFDKRAGQKA